jgi:hypothetical protein
MVETGNESDELVAKYLLISKGASIAGGGIYAGKEDPRESRKGQA